MKIKNTKITLIIILIILILGGGGAIGVYFGIFANKNSNVNNNLSKEIIENHVSVFLKKNTFFYNPNPKNNNKNADKNKIQMVTFTTGQWSGSVGSLTVNLIPKLDTNINNKLNIDELDPFNIGIGWKKSSDIRDSDISREITKKSKNKYYINSLTPLTPSIATLTKKDAISYINDYLSKILWDYNNKQIVKFTIQSSNISISQEGQWSFNLFPAVISSGDSSTKLNSVTLSISWKTKSDENIDDIIKPINAAKYSIILPIKSDQVKKGVTKYLNGKEWTKNNNKVSFSVCSVSHDKATSWWQWTVTLTPKTTTLRTNTIAINLTWCCSTNKQDDQIEKKLKCIGYNPYNPDNKITGDEVKKYVQNYLSSYIWYVAHNTEKTADLPITTQTTFDITTISGAAGQWSVNLQEKTIVPNKKNLPELNKLLIMKLNWNSKENENGDDIKGILGKNRFYLQQSLDPNKIRNSINSILNGIKFHQIKVIEKGKTPYITKKLTDESFDKNKYTASVFEQTANYHLWTTPTSASNISLNIKVDTSTKFIMKIALKNLVPNDKPNNNGITKEKVCTQINAGYATAPDGAKDRSVHNFKCGDAVNLKTADFSSKKFVNFSDGFVSDAQNQLKYISSNKTYEINLAEYFSNPKNITITNAGGGFDYYHGRAKTSDNGMVFGNQVNVYENGQNIVIKIKYSGTKIIFSFDIKDSTPNITNFSNMFLWISFKKNN